MAKDIKKQVKEIVDRLSPHLNNSTLFYGVALALIVLTFFFVAYPAYSKITEGYQHIDDFKNKIEDYKDRKEALYSDYNALKTRINKAHSEVNAAIQDEVLPSGPEETELVRFFERKAQEFNVSSRDFLEVASISFSKPKTDVQHPYIGVKLNLIGSYENFYRFTQMLEQSGLIVEVDDVERFSSAYKAELKEGDVIEYIVRSEEEKEPVIFPWVLTETLNDLNEGEEMVLQIRRYNEKKGVWDRMNITYEGESGDEDEASSGLKLVVAEEYTRQFGIEKISAKIIEGDEITGEGQRVEFTVELIAYYLPREE